MLKFAVPVVVVAMAVSAVLFATQTTSAGSVAQTASQDAFDTPSGWPGFQLGGDRLIIGKDFNRPITAGFLFDNLSIPACVTITDARLTLTQSGWGYNLTSKFAAEDIASPGLFTSTDRPSTKWANGTTEKVEWDWPKANDGDLHETPDLSAIIQELVDTYGAIDSVAIVEHPDPATGANEFHEWGSVANGEGAEIDIEWLEDGGSGYGYGCTPPTATPVGPTATSTNTPVPPTATNTPVPTATPTDTPVPPTPTNTPVPPTATPTDTPVPPTPTPTPDHVGHYMVWGAYAHTGTGLETIPPILSGAVCDAGDIPTGGGYKFPAPVLPVSDPVVRASFSDGFGWELWVDSSVPITIDVQVLCADLTP